MSHKHDLQQVLHKNSLRCTAARLAVLQVLQKADHPLSQDEVAQQLTDHSINKVTIYRVLHSFASRSIIHKAYVRDRVAYYELAHHCGKVQCHPHFTCTNCGQTYCLVDAKIPLVSNLSKGFKIERQQVSLQGLCPKCSSA